MAVKNDAFRVGSNFSEIVRTHCPKCPACGFGNSKYMLTKTAAKNDEIRVGSNFSQMVRTENVLEVVSVENSN